MSIGKKYIYISLVFVILSGFIMKDVFGIENNNIFDEILDKTNSVVVETGLIIYYDTKNDGKKECINWLEKMNLYDEKSDSMDALGSYVKIDMLSAKNDVNIRKINNYSKLENNITLNDAKLYCREFQYKNVYGYIESRRESNNTKVEIYIRKFSNKNEITDLCNRATNSISKGNSNISQYKYIKCRNAEKNTIKLQYDIEQLLIKLGAENMTEVKVNKGYSTVAYMNQYTPVKDNGKLIDLNYAVLKGNGENYIIIATPIIDITY